MKCGGTDVLKRDILEETRQEDKFHNKKELKEYLKSEIEKQGENVVIRDLDVSLIEDFNYLFYGIANGVKTLDLSGWKTSNVKDMKYMFHNSISLKSLDVSGWNTSNMTSMRGAFSDCMGLKSINLSGWDTSNVEDMGWMFSSCNNLESLDLSGWNTSNVNDMGNMFSDCSKLKSLDLSGWDTSSVNEIDHMFDNCPAPYDYDVVYNKIVRV